MSSFITTLNPATGSELCSYPSWTGEQIERAVADGAAAAAAWGRAPLETRVAAVRRLAEELRRADRSESRKGFDCVQ
jgi:succinate-semialdehyde dehydrogenase/glutarate-semialdehyde dehydrogenase